MLSSLSILRELQSELEGGVVQEKTGKEHNKLRLTTTIILKNNKATITHATHQLGVTVTAA